MNTKLTAISFFTGAGGLDIGFESAGFDIKLCVEIEEKYCETLQINHPNWNVHQGDIMDYDKNLVFEKAGLGLDEKVDVIIGGSPCQSFSTAGKRQAFDDPRGKAMLKFADLIEEIKPRVFVLENVKGLLSAALKHRPIKDRGKESSKLKNDEKPGSAVSYLLNKLPNYNVSINLANAADYGVAQKRERVFIVGVRKDITKTYEFPTPSHNKLGSKGKGKWISVGSLLVDVDSEIERHNYQSYSAERLKYMKMIPIGGNWRDLPEEIVQDAMGGAYYSGGGKVGFFRRIKPNEPAPTLLTSPIQKSTNLGHPFEDRPLSIEEYLRIQGFPPDYILAGGLSDQYKQIGNAVPIKLSEKIATSIHDLLK